MYRLLIADDEEIIVNGLYDIFSNLDSVELDVYKAYSGEEAIGWLSRTRIDIALTDIHMPEIDGLRLLDEIKKRWPWCRVIFLTGHSEFNYAYQAIQYSNVRYILKTEGYDKIIRTVESVARELDDENQTNEMIQNAKDQIDLARDLFCQKYFFALLNNDSSLKMNAEEFERLFIHLDADEPVMLVLGEILTLPKSVDFWEKNQIMYSIKQLLVRYFSMHVNSLAVPLGDDKIAVFVQTRKAAGCTDQDDRSMSVFLKGTLEMVQSACREKLNTPVNFVLAEKSCKWGEIAEKYVALMELASRHISHDMEAILDERDYRKQIQAFVPAVKVQPDSASALLQGLLYRKDLSDLYHCVETGEEEAYFDLLGTWLDPLSKIRDKNDAIALEAYQTIITFFLSCMNRSRLVPRFSAFCNLNRLHDSENYTTWEEAARHLTELSHMLFDMQKEEQCKRTNEIIDFVQQYIESHLSEDLSLTSLSEKTYLNPSYLSRLYHQTTGHKLSGFIESSRIKKAKELLENPYEKIYEIAKKVGYDTAASFTRLFKKAEGISPLEYRDSFQSAQRQESQK
ncbi:MULTISPECIES: response regulator transcription factor [Hungatella]|uniref:Stage 0 sporulation protein A homolog n=1 Tax=Hungatella hathewayi TaxID=154046 RepID=A0AAW9WG24_9FIRM|nr:MULTISPECIES: response regulator [Hungatella]MCD7996188.1 response regulator [Clostridiales bacterium]MCQ4828596.1 response regulator [Hungatella sp. SL.1.14]MUB63701.1 response regulator [Hungatella hathewayi]CUP70108.1 AraC family transcriptional regulator [Hungatella hathewayi]